LWRQPGSRRSRLSRSSPGDDFRAAGRSRAANVPTRNLEIGASKGDRRGQDQGS
jgi:hypothetical protein